MHGNNQARVAYHLASQYRSQRDQDADVFRHVIVGLKAARGAGPMQRTRAIADNRRLWMAVANLISDPANPLPAKLRAAILSVAFAVQRDMENNEPDLEFLATVNEQVAAGLSRKGPAADGPRARS